MAEIKSFPNNQDEYSGAEDVMRWLHGRTSGVFSASGNAAVAAAGGLSSPACDAAALADNLLALTRMDAAQRAAMGQSAKEYYLAHYRRSELLRKLEHFILEGRI